MAYDANRLLKLIRSFHCLEDCPTELVVPDFMPAGFAAWVAKTQGGGGTDAGLFILAVWSPTATWGLERHGSAHFEAIQALGNWDASMRDAFAAWALEPWWFR